MEQKSQAVEGPLDAAVGRPVTERENWTFSGHRPPTKENILAVYVAAAAAVATDIRQPHIGPARHVWKNKVEMRGCQECAWGKVAGCWRCGGR